MELAGEIADGANFSTTISNIDYHLECVGKGLKKSNRKLDDFRIILSTTGLASVDLDGTIAREKVKANSKG